MFLNTIRLITILITMMVSGSSAKAKGNEMLKTLVKQNLCYEVEGTIEQGKSTIIMLPGGPGISGSYLKSLFPLADSTNMNVVLLFLPNHDCVYKNKIKDHIKYPEAVQLLTSGIREISYSTEAPIVILGHSFGSRIAFDIFQSIDEPWLQKAIMLNMPYCFIPPKRFTDQVIRLTAPGLKTDTNDEYRVFWQRILPLYFYQEQSADLLDHLSEDIFWQGNESMMSVTQAPDATQWKRSKDINDMLFIDSSNDLIMPEDNAQWIESNFPGRRIEISHSSHFPMIENRDETIDTITHFITGRQSL
jgi:pimeloyl-ACP methyl ester carboxylesterase